MDGRVDALRHTTSCVIILSTQSSLRKTIAETVTINTWEIHKTYKDLHDMHK
jgi:hypothetical protein